MFAKFVNIKLQEPMTAELKPIHMLLAHEYRRHFYSQWGGLERFRDKKVLEVGCGYGGDGKLIAEVAKQVVCTDIYQDPRWNSMKEANLSFAIADAKKLSYPANFFDVTLAKDLLHHIDDPHQVLRQLGRVTKKGGEIIIIEANRYNPLFYAHLTKMLGHDHFTQKNFTNIIKQNYDNARFFFVESHFLPIENKWLKWLWYKLHQIANVVIPNAFKSYNIAIIKR